MPNNRLAIGGNMEENVPEPQIDNLRSNRTIIALPTNERADSEPKLKPYGTLPEVFQGENPSAEVSVKDVDGTIHDERVKFTKITDFNVESIVDAVPAFRKQKEELAILTDLRLLIQEPKLRHTVDKKGDRDKLISCLEEALKLLESTKH